MPYRLKQHESVRSGLARVVRDELKEAVSALTAAAALYDPFAVHRARQAAKKTRALLRLADVQLDRKRGKVDDRLARMGRALSDLRDADIALETFDTLRVRFNKALPRATFEAVRRRLAVPPQRAGGRRALRRARHQVIELAHASTAWRFGRGFGALQTGLGKGYKRAAKALDALERCSTDERAHDLRKRVKTHWYHVRMLEHASKALSTRRNALGRLDKTLGLDHDLTVLKTMVRSQRATTPAAIRARVIAMIEAEQRRRRRDAMALARALFSGAAREFVSQAKHDWREWRD